MEAETLLEELCAYHRVQSIDVQDVNWLLPFNRQFRKIADYNAD
jgi:hypothetical protein